MDTRKLESRLNEAWPEKSALATSAELANAGLGDRALAAALNYGLVYRLRRGAYVQAARWKPLKPWDREKLRLYAHVLTAPSEPVYSHFSAARLHGLFTWNCSALVHIIAPAPMTGASEAKDVQLHHDALTDADMGHLTLRSGGRVRVTTLERTVVDCARVGGFAEAVIIGDHALSKGARFHVMWAMVNAMPGRRGVRRARRVLTALDGRSESPGESRTRLIIAGMKIDQPELQKELMTGGRIYRPDFVWEKQKLIVEFDGDIKYFAYRPTSEVILEERKRERRLMEAGWRFVRLERRDLANPEEIRRRIMDAYSAPVMRMAA